MSPQRIPAALVQLLTQLAAISTAGGSNVQIVEIPEGVDADSFMAEFIEQQEAEHRKACASCAAKHEAIQKKAASDAEAVLKKARDLQNAATGAGVGAATGVGTRTPLGFMVFTTFKGETRPAPGSFDTDHAAVEAKLKKFLNTEVTQKMFKMAKALDLDTPVHDIRPVFGD